MVFGVVEWHYNRVLRGRSDDGLAGPSRSSVPEVEHALCVPPGTLSRRFPERYGKLRAVCAARRDEGRRRLLARCRAALDAAIEGPEVRSVHDVARSLRAVVLDLIDVGERPSLHRAMVYAGLPPTFCTEPCARLV